MRPQLGEIDSSQRLKRLASIGPLERWVGQSQAIRTIACHASTQVGASDARGPRCEAYRQKRDRRCRTENDEVADAANAHAKGHRVPERREARRPSARTRPQTATRVPDWLPLRRTQHHRQAHLLQADESMQSSNGVAGTGDGVLYGNPGDCSALQLGKATLGFS